MSKICQYDEATISIDKGYASLHIAETSQQTFQIDVHETIEDKLYFGIPFLYGKKYFSWDEIVKMAQQSFS